MSQTQSIGTYEEALADFNWEPPEKYNFARDVIDRWATSEPSKLAIKWVDDEGSEKDITFLELSSRSRKLCNALADAGVQRGDTVVLMLGRNVEWWEILTACIRMGVICSPGTTQLSPKDISYRMNAAGAVCFITDLDNAPKHEEVASD